MVITTMLRNIKDTGYPLRVRMWALLTENTWQLAISDIVMVASTWLSVPLQKAFRGRGFLRWEKGGMPVQSIFQLAWLSLMVKYVKASWLEVSVVSVATDLLTEIVGPSC